MEVGKRIPSLDYVKGATIFLVVWMHVIQYCAGQTFENVLFTKVYGFHMPYIYDNIRFPVLYKTW